ncbi:hypothetical protein FAI40_07155 [Acetobacteraceae bacterium]|nr:hypothetical protein FAI40_07155 [Acetobacteraceae bacterium]
MSKENYEYSEAQKNEVKALLKQALESDEPTEIAYEKIAKTFPADEAHPTIPNCPLIHGNELPQFLGDECTGLNVKGFGKTEEGETTIIFFRKVD